MAATFFGLTQLQALAVLFIGLPIVAAAVIVPLAAWWVSRGKPTPILTSDILAHGVPGQAEILTVRTLGSIVELRPMVRFVLRVHADSEPFDLEVVQALPRGVIGRFRPGDLVEVRLTPDHAAGAVVWGDLPAG